MRLIDGGVEEDGRCFRFCFCSHSMLFYRAMDQFKAAKKGDLQQLRATLTVDNVNDVDEGLTALHSAADDGSVDCVKYCIELGANVNARTKYGYTPSYYASSNGHVSVVRELLDAGTLVDATGIVGWTPLYCALRYERIDVARLLIDRGGKVSDVKLDEHVPAIPDWVTVFVESRSKCRIAAITIIGIHKYHH
jgi:ankyrin repeat protein